MPVSFERTFYYTASVQALRYSVQTVYEDRKRRPQSPEMLRLVYIRSGSCTWIISGKPYSVASGDIVLLNNTEQRVQCDISPDNPVVQEIIRFSPVAFVDCAACLSVFFDRSDSFSNVFTGDYPERVRILALIDWLRCEAEEQKPRDDVAMLSLTRLLLVLVWRAAQQLGMTAPAQTDTPATAQHYQMLCETIAYIKSALTEDLSVELLAARAGISRGYFSRIFNSLMGMTVPQFVRALRLGQVQKLVSDDKMNLLDAIYAAGFGSVSAYYKALHAGDTKY